MFVQTIQSFMQLQTLVEGRFRGSELQGQAATAMMNEPFRGPKRLRCYACDLSHLGHYC